jgi:hypothetical protein
MTKQKSKRMTPAEQAQRFKETARKLGSDESAEAFERLLKGVAKPKPKRP